MRNLRRARTINQKELARLVGISQQYLSKIERGLMVPAPDVRARIAAILGVSADDLWEPVSA